MKVVSLKGSILTAGLMLGLAASLGAQQANNDYRKDDAIAAGQDKKADKAQTKADKSEEKLAKSGKAKKAAKNQDKADRLAGTQPR